MNFLQALVDHPSHFARLFVARARGQLVAGVLVLSGGGETFVWWSGASTEARRTLAYPYLMTQVLRRATEWGDARFNIGSSGGKQALERFKESMGATPRPIWVHHIKPQRTDLFGRVLGVARAIRRRV